MKTPEPHDEWMRDRLSDLDGTAPPDWSPEPAWDRLEARLHPKRRRLVVWWWAAAGIALLTAGWWYWPTTTVQPETWASEQAAGAADSSFSEPADSGSQSTASPTWAEETEARADTAEPIAPKSPSNGPQIAEAPKAPRPVSSPEATPDQDPVTPATTGARSPDKPGILMAASPTEPVIDSIGQAPENPPEQVALVSAPVAGDTLPRRVPPALLAVASARPSASQSAPAKRSRFRVKVAIPGRAKPAPAQEPIPEIALKTAL